MYISSNVYNTVNTLCIYTSTINILWTTTTTVSSKNYKITINFSKYSNQSKLKLKRNLNNVDMKSLTLG